jgi:hypothetical protein
MSLCLANPAVLLALLARHGAPGDGTLLYPGPLIPTGDAPVDLAAGDWNGDGHLDLAAADRLGLSLLFGRGNGTFVAAEPRHRQSFLSDASAVAAADLDRDGHQDLLALTSTRIS